VAAQRSKTGAISWARTVSEIRIVVEARDVPARAAARRLGITVDDFEKWLPDLLTRGFPPPDATTGNFDLKAIEAWQDGRSGLNSSAFPVARTPRVLF
jgi:hypothetical protein